MGGNKRDKFINEKSSQLAPVQIDGRHFKGSCMFDFEFGASPGSFSRLCEELCDEAISENTLPPRLPRLRLAMTVKGGQ